MKRCLTCMHWDKSKFMTSGQHKCLKLSDGSMALPAYPVLGYPKAVDTSQTRPAIGTDIFTRADFGCALHKC